MSSAKRRERLSILVAEYKDFKRAGKLDLTSEETIRTWLNELLQIFNWDVRDTSQILQEKILSKAEKDKLKEIGSQNTRPDYTFKLAKQKLTFLDAKDISVRIKDDPDAAFQIKSYGWSILAPCAFISNFEEFAIYDCSYVPEKDQAPGLGRVYFTIDEYVENFDLLETHLLKENVYAGRLNELYSVTLSDNKHIVKITPDIRFAEQLSDFRLRLAENIFLNNSDFIKDNSENLSYIVQIIINRILFIRVCEARKIEEEGLLLTFKEEGFWEKFKSSSYFTFYDHYDGPLFERADSIQKIKIDDDVFKSLLTYLYYPSPYRFDVIPTKLFSDIYEIFLSRKLLIEDNVVKDAIKSEYSKTKGAVSTPQFIVQEVIQKTLQKDAILAKGLEGVLNTKVLDIACGSGVFAIEIYDYLEELFRQIYISTGDREYGKYFIETNSETITNLFGKKAIIENCIFGVDIDPEAVEVTKMSLSLKIVDSVEYADAYSAIGIFGSKILNGVGNNIRCGNSLVESDILEMYPDLADREEELLKTNIFDWSDEHGFKHIFDKYNGFDYIVGNPPYVEVKNYNVELPYMHQYIKDKFTSSNNGKIDLSIPFIEKALTLLSPKGRLGFVIQKRFFKTAYGKRIREIISSASLLSLISDFETTKIFRDRITYVAILILDKLAPEAFKYKLYRNEVETLASEIRETEINQYLTFSANSISANPWSFDDAELIGIKERILKLGTLGDYARVRVGVQVLWDRAYHIRPTSIKKGIIRGKTNLENDFQIELNACRPLVANENFYPYKKVAPDLFIIFPYEVQDGNIKEIEFSKFKKKFPLAGKYLARNKSVIQENVEHYDSKEYWHLYTRANNHGATYAKILVPMTSLDTFASVTFSDQTYCDNANMFFIDAPEKEKNYLYALSAVINSTVYSVLARSIANPQQSGYFKFNKQFLEPVPFPVDTFRNNKELVNQVAAIAMNIEEKQEKYISGSPTQKRTYKRILTTLWNSLDDKVFEMYGLSDEDKIFFRTRGRSVNRIEIL